MIFAEYKRYHDILKLLVEIISNYNKNSLVFKSGATIDVPIYDLKLILKKFIKALDDQKIGDIVGRARKENNKYSIDSISKFLINGWYDECAYHDPLVETPTLMTKPESEESFKRLKFPSWRIAQAYYSIYHTTAAVVRLKEYTKDQSHNLILRSLVNHFSTELDNFYTYPFCCYIKDEKFINKSSMNYKEDEMKKVLQELHEFKKQKGKADSRTTNFLHIFRTFREWCNYNSAEVLILFRSKHLRDYLDINLRTLIYIINGMNEIYLIKFLGYEQIAEIFEDFYKNTIVNLKFEPKTIMSRFDIYEECVEKLDDSFILANKAKNRYKKESDLGILNELGKNYFCKSWLFHSRKTFNDVLRLNSSFKKAEENLSRILKHIEDLSNLKSIPYKTEYFEDRSISFIEVPREKIKKMKRERKEKAKFLNVRISSEWSNFFVKSQTDPTREYKVSFEPNVSCDCSDFTFRRKIVRECKHIAAASPIWSNMQLV